MKTQIQVNVALSFCIALLFTTSTVFANDAVVRPWLSPRTVGMGGVQLTTGLYEQNFFANPARVTANPKWKISILDLTTSTNSTTPKTIGDLASGGDDVLTKIASTSGSTSYARLQLSLLNVYIPGAKWSVAVAPLLFGAELGLALHKNFDLDPQALSDIGSAVTVGRKLLSDDSLSVGITAHAGYRLSSKSNYTLLSLIRGDSMSPGKSGGQGAELDFDLGATYELPYKPREDMKISVAATVNQLLGGKFSNLKLEPISALKGSLPLAQPRVFGLGVNVSKAELWKFHDAQVAFELTDIGAVNGSAMKAVHIGGEIRWGLLAPRLGLYQGYWSAGLGIDLKVLQLEVASWAEELSTNVGYQGDRRYALRFALQI